MRFVAHTVLLATLAFAGSCHASDTATAPPTDANVVGVYVLNLVNGGPLPFPYAATSVSRVDVVGGSLALTADHKFTDVFTTREVLIAGGSNPDQSNTLTGTWALDSHNLTLTYPGLGSQLAIVTGNLISINAQGLTLRYSR